MCLNPWYVSSKEINVMRRMRVEGHTFQSIASITGRSYPTVYKFCGDVSKSYNRSIKEKKQQKLRRVDTVTKLSKLLVKQLELAA